MKSLRTVLVSLVCCLVLVSCFGSVARRAPVVVSTSPAADAVGVALGASVTCTFDKSIDPAAVTTASFILAPVSGTAVAASVTCADTIITLTPDADLQAGTEYEATVTTGVMDLDGNPLAEAHTWRFTTQAEAFAVVSTNPPNAATGVDAATAVSATFNRAPDPATLGVMSFLLEQSGVPVAGSVAVSGDTATFTPDEALAPATLYDATVTTAVADAGGMALAADYAWSFTAADGAWNAVVDVDDSASVSSQYVRVAAAGDGLAMAIWEQGTEDVVAAFHSAAGWQTPQVVDTFAYEVSAPRVHMNSGGQAVAVWVQSDGAYDQVFGAVFDGVSTWTTATQLSSSSTTVNWPAAVIDSSGNAAVVWEQENNIWWREYSAALPGWGSASFSTVESDAAAALSPRIAICPDNSLYVAWSQDVTTTELQLRRRLATTVWEDAVSVDTDENGTSNHQLAGDGLGNAIVSWEQYDVSADRAYVRRYLGATSSWEALPLQVDSTTGGTASLFPRVAGGAGGHAAVVWRSTVDGMRNVYASVYTPGSGWSAADLLETNDDYHCESADIALDPSGHAVAVWYRHDGTYFRTWAARYGGGAWQPEDQVSTAEGHSWEPYVACDATGGMVSAWYLLPAVGDNEIRAAWFE